MEDGGSIRSAIPEKDAIEQGVQGGGIAIPAGVCFDFGNHGAPP
jgi:hypothetical protein